MIRVASVPARHPYVSAITDPDSVSLLPDPVPVGATLPGQWWPPRWLEPAYLRRRIGEFDLLHVHFGFDTTPADVLQTVCATLSAHRKPLLVTVHDLHNPHFLDSATHRRRLDVLVSQAAEVITLTDGAAGAIEAAWQRSVTVIAHPHLLAPADIGVQRIRRERAIVAVHGKSLRANTDPWPLIDALNTAAPGLSVRLDLDSSAPASPHAPQDLSDRLARYRARGVDVRVHPEFDDDELTAYLHEIDVLVLPYRFGTHSGWVELCHDAGLAAVVPNCGYFHEQHRMPTFRYDRAGLDREGLLAAVRTAVAGTTEQQPGEDRERRRRRAAQRGEIREAHTRLYRRALAGAAA